MKTHIGSQQPQDVNVSQSVDSSDRVSIMKWPARDFGPSVAQDLVDRLRLRHPRRSRHPSRPDRLMTGWLRSANSAPLLRKRARTDRRKNKGPRYSSQPDDARHVFAESYRNVRSSIFFMPSGPRPKTMLITSSVLTRAIDHFIELYYHGAIRRPHMMIDGDLRRELLCVTRSASHPRSASPRVLKQEVNWRK